MESRELTFEHHENRLEGTLLYPGTSGRWPAVVTLQGSGHTERDNFGYFPAIWDLFLEAGFAVLAYDKPGAGGSSGDWRESTLTERADEALTAIHCLQQDPQIIAGSVGLFGHSQGGWVAPIAASRGTRDVAFVVAQSAPGITSQDQCIHDVEHSMRQDGHAEESIDRGVSFMKSLVNAAERHASFSDVSESLLVLQRGEPWWDYFSIDDEKTWAYFRRSWTEDPHPARVWREVRCPVLALFGESDHLLPVRESVETIRGALHAAGNSDATIVVLENANHQFLVAVPDEFIDGYEDVLRGWLERHHADLLPDQ